MIEKKDILVSQISWLSYPKTGGGRINEFYVPESIQEFIEICQNFNRRGLDYDLIGHTSNIYFMPDYSVERMISTRKLTNWVIKDNRIIADCGVPVKRLAREMIEKGYEGFEGLIDLPGTVASAIYGNAGCFGSSVSSLLLEAQIITSNGNIERVESEWFDFKKRSSALKRGEKKGIIVSLEFKIINGDSESLKKKAEANHSKRISVQPEPVNSLGSIFANSGHSSILGYSINAIGKIYGTFLKLKGNTEESIIKKRNHLTFVLLRATDVEPYVRTWNWYQWRDDKSHQLFWKYVKLHKLLFTHSDFEIEIKRNNLRKR